MKRAPKKVLTFPMRKLEERSNNERFSTVLNEAMYFVLQKDKSKAHAALGQLEQIQRDAPEGGLAFLMSNAPALRSARLSLRELIRGEQAADSLADVIYLSAVRTDLRVRARRERRGGR